MSSATTPRAGRVWSAPAADRSRFGESARPHLGWLYSLARRLVGDPEAAEDLAEGCLLNAYHAYGDLDDLGALPALLKQILVASARDHWRAEGRVPEERSLHGLDGDPLYPTSTEDPLAYCGDLRLDLLSGFEIDDLDAVLVRLQTIYRVPLVLVHMEGCTIAEVADLVGASPNTVLSRLRRGRQRFERQLWDYAQERGPLADMQASTGRTQQPH